MANSAQPRGYPGTAYLISILLYADVLQQRNKPKEAPKAPEKAPFFLPTLPGVEHRFDVTQAEQEKKSKKSTKRFDNAAGSSESVFYQKLVAEEQDGNCMYSSAAMPYGC